MVDVPTRRVEQRAVTCGDSGVTEGTFQLSRMRTTGHMFEETILSSRVADSTSGSGLGLATKGVAVLASRLEGGAIVHVVLRVRDNPQMKEAGLVYNERLG